VKNVAGFDLVRLHTGAFGTLGAITEVSLRLHARPAVDVVLAGRLGSADRMALDHLMPRLIANRAPLPMMVHRTPGDAPELWARVSGNPARAAALQQALHALGMGDAREVPPHTMQSALLDTPAEAVVLRARTLRSDALPFVSAALDALPEATVSYDPVRGSLRAVLPSHADHTLDRDIATWSRLAAASGATHALSVVVDQGRTVAAPRRSPRTTLEAGIKRALDPRDVLNRLAPCPPSPPAYADV
jgi:glycolate oxidase FAD binding subunit